MTQECKCQHDCKLRPDLCGCVCVACPTCQPQPTTECENCNFRESNIGYYSPCPNHDGSQPITEIIKDALKQSIADVQQAREKTHRQHPDLLKPTTDEQCPVCGYYCLGKGGIGCIDKPTLVAEWAKIKTTPCGRGQECGEWHGICHEAVAEIVSTHYIKKSEI